jgi:ribosome-binding protein aMBF1 (putative translation factor)
MHCKVCGGDIVTRPDKTGPDGKPMMNCGTCFRLYVESEDGMVDGNVTGSEEKQERVQLLEKVAKLEKQKNDVIAMKKSMSKDYNDQIKDLDDEIKGILKQLEA